MNKTILQPRLTQDERPLQINSNAAAPSTYCPCDTTRRLQPPRIQLPSWQSPLIMIPFPICRQKYDCQDKRCAFRYDNRTPNPADTPKKRQQQNCACFEYQRAHEGNKGWYQPVIERREKCRAENIKPYQQKRKRINTKGWYRKLRQFRIIAHENQGHRPC